MSDWNDGKGIRRMAEMDLGDGLFAQLSCGDGEVEISLLQWKKGRVRRSMVGHAKREQFREALDIIGIEPARVEPL